MDKILLEVFCVSTSKRYDFWVSKKMEIKKVKEKLIEQVESFEDNQNIFQNPEEIFMFRKEDNSLLEESLTIEQASVKSGDQIVLI